MRFGKLSLCLMVIVVFISSQCFAIDQPFDWYGSFGPDRVEVSFLMDTDGRQKVVIYKLSKDRFLCDEQTPIAEGIVRPARADTLRLTLALSNGSTADVVLKPSRVTVGGIPYLQLTGKLTQKGRETPLSIKGIVDNKFKQRLNNCIFEGQSSSTGTQVDYAPGLLHALIRPSMQASFERKVKEAGFAWRSPASGHRTPFSSYEGEPSNLMEISGISAGDEGKVGDDLLKQDFILDVQRVRRPHDKLPENNSAWVGQLGDSQVIYNGYGRLTPANCDYDAEGTPFYLHLQDISTYTLVLGEKSGRSVEVSSKRQFSVERGIPVERIETSDFDLDGKKTRLALKRALAGFELRLSRCSEVGPESEILNVVVYPDAEQEARDYFTQRQFDWTTRRYAAQEAINIYTLSVPVGSEVDEVATLKRLSWVVDVWRQPAGAGTPPQPLYFPARSVYRTLSEDQENLRVKLRNALQDLFVKVPIDDSMLAIEGRGLRYAFAVEAPMDVLGNSSFKGFWIKAKVLFEFSRTLNQEDETKAHDTMLVGIPDAWLARWPSPTKPPPEGHYDHLSPTGGDRSKNFDSMKWLQQTIVDRLRVQWSGIE
ncbi:hypothetical protein [Bradyrhizobium sp. LHD-71]|uniref:hypothetical protein n=1 Tax=Bradyrhizobium sp. LHD-71 TaxID=3072141 RepID=UPI00280F94CD|nr:hypothetical protein [Bradyrhizobium sp. LHD-71]MDQ8729278.1 hypothetical protein [Bradyrhizobium sp. LHD-71]